MKIKTCLEFKLSKKKVSSKTNSDDSNPSKKEGGEGALLIKLKKL